ncbi:hypothetical protein Axi01nite_00590 [Actinoplanes xinjiangensis]|nr:hypothetical protein Axi01nite_00590 [Actinoplanes xinjiangensis]
MGLLSWLWEQVEPTGPGSGLVRFLPDHYQVAKELTRQAMPVIAAAQSLTVDDLKLIGADGLPGRRPAHRRGEPRSFPCRPERDDDVSTAQRCRPSGPRTCCRPLLSGTL